MDNCAKLGFSLTTRWGCLVPTPLVTTQTSELDLLYVIMSIVANRIFFGYFALGVVLNFFDAMFASNLVTMTTWKYGPLLFSSADE